MESGAQVSFDPCYGWGGGSGETQEDLLRGAFLACCDGKGLGVAVRGPR